jgi:hypothetical protein
MYQGCKKIDLEFIKGWYYSLGFWNYEATIPPVQASKPRPVQRLRWAYEASYNENHADKCRAKQNSFDLQP